VVARDFLLPDLGEGLTDGEVVRWLVAVGDTVEVDQPVAEVETAKAVVEVPSPFAGTVTALHAAVGQEVAVGKPLMTVDAAGSPALDASGDAPAGARGSEGVEEGDGASGSVLVGYGTAGGARARRRRPVGGPAEAPRGNGASAPRTPPARPLAKPPVRKMAKDLGVDLAEVPGSGPGGTVTREDVRAYVDAARPVAEREAEAPLAEAARKDVPELTERIPLRGVRKRIAEKMATSRREIPEAVTWVDCDATALMGLRADLNASQAVVRVSPLAIIMRACVAGLREFPEVNARLDTGTGEIVLHRFVHLGLAAHTERGLVVPVIRNAHRLTTLELAAELNRLAAGAREGTLAPGDMTGGTFTVSNYGSFGVDGGSPVINHPEAAILGVGRISERPWVVAGVVAVRQVMQLSIAFDHRVCDGGEAAGFLRFVADCVERPGRLLGVL